MKKIYFVRPNSLFSPPFPLALLLDECMWYCQRVLVDESGVFPVDIMPLWISMLIYHLGMNNRLVGGRSSETWSHPIDMIVIIIMNMISNDMPIDVFSSH
jgi:hypothetical protein